MPANNEKMFFYDRFAEQFDKRMNQYDLQRRMEIIFKELLTENLSGKLLLDAGCGTGWFSREALARGAEVVSLDVGENILSQVAKKCSTRRVVGSVLKSPFYPGLFDIVICTEVIEHTPNPQKALHEMHRLLKKDGILILTVPNQFWHPVIVVANKLKLRPYEGFENWVGWAQLRTWLNEIGFSLVEMRGFHLFPFILPFTYKVLQYLDRCGEAIGPFMLNICVKALKK